MSNILSESLPIYTLYPSSSLRNLLIIIIITTTTITTTTSLLRLSQTMLKQFLSHEVLDRYSFLFKQKTENSSPDGDSLESWLQSLLAQMQASIEQHVQSAMDNSSM